MVIVIHVCQNTDEAGFSMLCPQAEGGARATSICMHVMYVVYGSTTVCMYYVRSMCTRMIRIYTVIRNEPHDRICQSIYSPIMSFWPVYCVWQFGPLRKLALTCSLYE